MAATPLGPNTPGSCQAPSAIYPLYDFTTYAATVTLPPGQWTMSTRLGNRPDIANIAGGAGNYLYTDVYLDNRANGSSSVLNTSPQFDPQDIPIQYVCVNQRSTFGFSATEPEGDSLVYSLTAPLDNCGTPVAYNPYPGADAGTLPVANSTTCRMAVTALNGGNLFTPSLPIPVAFDTTGSCPLRQGMPAFRFNQTARTITFTPSRYVPVTTAGDGSNKYQVVVLIEEYRRLGGVRRLIGRVRREAVLIVTNCAGNTLPTPVQATAQTINSGTLAINTADTTQLEIAACSYSRVVLRFTDPDNLKTPSAHQLLTVTLPADINTNPQLLASGDIGTFGLSGNGTETPVGTFIFQPSPAVVGRIIRVNIRTEDNANPIKGVQNRVVLIRVVRRNPAAVAAAGITSSAAEVCAGASVLLQARDLRPDSVRRLASNTTVAQTYAYRWTVRGDGLAANQASSAAITATPTRTSRYTLEVSPTSGFGPGCSDTTSILVRVLPAVAAPTVSRSGALLTSSYASGNQWYRDGLPLTGATGRTLTVVASGNYTVQTTVSGPAGSCLSPMSAAQAVVLGNLSALSGTNLSVVPNPTPDGRLNVLLTGYRQPIELRLFDALGRLLNQISVPNPNPQGTSQPLDLGSAGGGVYLLQVRTATSLETRRIVRE
ncbi:T9SS type A sorting domain-containing protein [Hymenobacter glaciei]|uniref:T9SS type A sorting domain-containing protein n=1 Tax=Hymenobacter glaciei TaxID=877209 RepID=UPI0031EF0CEC